MWRLPVRQSVTALSRPNHSVKVANRAFSRLQCVGKGDLETSRFERFRHSSCQCCHPHQQRLFSSGKDSVDEANQEVTSVGDAPESLTIPGAQKGGRKLAIVFTCTVCDTRAAKQFTENAYQNGVVIVQCPGCNSRHLIADNLGFFGDEEGGWNIENAMAKLGENVNVVNEDNVFELSLEDLYGEEAIDKVVAESQDAKEGGKTS